MKPSPSTRTSLALLLVVVTALGGCTTIPSRGQDLLFGTALVITAYDRRDRSDLLDDVFDHLDGIYRRMHPTAEGSDLVNIADGAGTPVDIAEDTLTVLQTAVEVAEKTGGAFDPTIGPLVRAWGFGTDDPAVPSEAQIEEALALVDYRRLTVDAATGSATLALPQMALELGAIAKGFAADEAVRLLKDGGIIHALLDFGGNIATIGTKPDGSEWRIGIQDPNAARGVLFAVIETHDEALVTSGGYERVFEQDGVRYHHILDTRTGYPAASGVTSATIVGPTGLIADALSTSAYIMGIDDAGTLLAAYPQVEMVLVDGEKNVYITDGLRSRLSLIDESFTIVDTPLR